MEPTNETHDIKRPAYAPPAGADQIAQFPQLCARADRRSVKAQHGMNLREALVQEWYDVRDGGHMPRGSS